MLKTPKMRHFCSQNFEINTSPTDFSTFLTQKKNASISNNPLTFDNSPTIFTKTSKSEVQKKELDPHQAILKLDHKSLNVLKFSDAQYNLSIIILSECRLKDLPCDFAAFPNLKQLCLDFNNFTKVPALLYERLPLENFSIKRNLIEALPENYHKWVDSLLGLDVSFNQIDRLDSSISTLKYLRRLQITNNNFIKIPTSLLSLQNLEEFGLDWFKYTFPGLPITISGEILQSFLRFCGFLASESKQAFSFLDLIEGFSGKTVELTRLYSKKRNLIHRAAFDNDIGVLRSLITLVPDLMNSPDSENYTPLFLSILEENYNATKILLYAGAEPSIGVGMLGSCVHLAVVKKEVFLLQDLLRKGGDPNSMDQQGNTPLHLLFSTFSNNQQKSEKMAKILMEFNPNTHLKNKELWTCLHLAVKLDQSQALKWALQFNKSEGKEVFDMDGVGGEVGMSLMHLAGYQGNREILRLLLDYGCDYYVSDSLGRLPKNLCVSDQLLMKMIKSTEKRDISNKILKKTQSIVPKKNLLIDIDDGDSNEEFHSKINLPNAKNTIHTTFFSTKSKYFTNQNRVKNEIFFENEKNDENMEIDIDESMDSKRHKNVRVILKSPNNIEKIEQFQNMRMSYFRKSCGQLKYDKNTERSLSLKTFSFKNLENLIINLTQTNDKLKTGLQKISEINASDDIFNELSTLMSLQQKEITLLMALNTEIDLLESLFREEQKKWGENKKEFESVKSSLNRKNLAFVDFNAFLLNFLGTNAIKNENSYENLRICLRILKGLPGFLGAYGAKSALRSLLLKKDRDCVKFNKIVVYEIFNLMLFPSKK